MQTIKGVVLDYGEVLCHHPPREKVERIAAAVGLDPRTFETRYHHGRGLYDRGDLSPAEYWSTVAADAVKLDDELVENLRLWDVDMWSDVNHEMAGWMDRLRAAGYKTAVLSNMHPDMARYVRSRFDWVQRLDCPVLSCELRLIKPDRAIYDQCVERLGLRPQETLFVDDREVNVEGAREAGLVALRFESVRRLREDLERMGFPLLPEPAEA